jgi:flagellar hook-associated protein 3 FlgL
VINRVTQQTVQRSTLANLQANLTRVSDLQARMSSGKTITKPSDDPAGTARAMALRSDQAAANQASRNADNGITWLGTTDDAMQASITALRSARDLVVQASSSGSVGATSREAIATAVDGIRASLLGFANTTVQGRPVFAGTTSDGVAFDNGTSATPYAWHGVAGATVDRRISPNATVRVDTDGAAAFGQGANSVFALLDNISADLRGTAEVSPRLAEVDTKLNGMLSQVANVGIRYKQVDDAKTAIAAKVQNIASSISGIENIDLPETIMELNMQQVAYQGALGAAAKVLQPTLMDFLK